MATTLLRAAIKLLAIAPMRSAGVTFWTISMPLDSVRFSMGTGSVTSFTLFAVQQLFNLHGASLRRQRWARGSSVSRRRVGINGALQVVKILEEPAISWN